MDPLIWGPGAWTFLHSVTLNYPKRPTYLDKLRFSQFFNNLQYALPCPTCSYHYQQNLKKYPIQLDSRDKLVAWLVKIHNEVNKKNEKSVFPLSEFYKKYQRMYSNEPPTIYSDYLPILLILIIVISILYFMKRKSLNPPF